MGVAQMSVNSVDDLVSSTRIAQDKVLQVSNLSCDVSEHSKEWWQRLASLEVLSQLHPLDLHIVLL